MNQTAQNYQNQLNQLFCRAIMSHNLEAAQTNLALGADIQTDKNWALEYSSSIGELRMVQFLVERGANIQECPNAIKYSAHNGHLPVVRYLLEQGADIDTHDHYPVRGSLRRGSLRNGQDEVVYFLIQNGANISVALHEAQRIKSPLLPWIEEYQAIILEQEALKVTPIECTSEKVRLRM